MICRCNFQFADADLCARSGVLIKYMATSSTAKASARQRAAALYSEVLRMRTSLSLDAMALIMRIPSGPGSMGFVKVVEADEVDSIVMAGANFSILEVGAML